MAIFSKRHYVWLASFFRDEVHRMKTSPIGSKESLAEIIDTVADNLFQDNRAFSKQRFLNAIYDPQNIKDLDLSFEDKLTLDASQDSNWRHERSRKSSIDLYKPDPEMTGDGLSKYDYEL